MRDLNLSSPCEILNILGLTFETARSDNDTSSLRKCLEVTGKVDLTPFNSEETSTFHYFVANGWSYLLKLTHSNPEDIPCDSHFYEKEIYHLRCALTHSSFKKDSHICEILTNLGCALSHVGRYAEAQEYFNKALSVNTEFGMALGNKGYGLYRYARVMYDGVHQFIFLQYARKFLMEAATKDNVYEDVRRGFSDLANHISTMYPLNELENFRQYNNSFATLSDDEVDYRTWCMNNKLFLNPLNDVLSQNIVTYDFLHTPTMTLKNGEKPIFQSIYNQIKQEFVSARFLYYEGVTNDYNKHYSDNDVKLYRLFDSPIYSLSVEKVKIAFRMSYSIFDKIAYLLNIYLDLNIDKNRISFRNIWHEKGNKRNPVNKSIFKENNWSLQGLYWLSKDLDEGADSPIEPEAKEIATIRNFIEHKSFKVVLFKNVCYDEMPETYEIEKYDFYEKTLKLLKLTRSALLYLSSILYEEESLKSPLGGVGTIEMEEL